MIYCQDSTKLLFLLRGEIVDLESSAPIANAKVKLIDTKGGSHEVYTDRTGRFELDLKQELSYSITVSKSSYLNAKGRETTIGSTESKIFVHRYEMQAIENVQHGFTAIDFDSAFSFKPILLSLDSILIYKKTPLIKKKAIANILYKQSKNEYSLSSLSSKGSKRKLSLKFIERDLLQLSIDGEKQAYYIIGYRTQHSQKYLLIKTDE